MANTDWDEADIFALPLLDGSEGFGQVLMADKGQALVLILSRSGPREAALRPVEADEVIAFLRVPSEPLDSGQWPVIGFDALPRPRSRFTDMTGAFDPTDPAIVEALANAWHGHLKWDYFPEADLLRNLLLEGVTPPG